jgi:membrane protein involved in colicin uptake
MEAEAASKKAAEQVKADEAKAKAAAEAARTAETEKIAATPAATTATQVKATVEDANGLGAAPTTASGGRVLPKEEVSDDVKAFLKTLQK